MTFEELEEMEEDASIALDYHRFEDDDVILIEKGGEGDNDND